MFVLKKNILILLFLTIVFHQGNGNNEVRGNLDKLAETFFNCLKIVLKNGIEEYNLPSLDPLKLKDGLFRFDRWDVNANLTYNDIVVTNIADFKFSVDLDGSILKGLNLKNYDISFDLEASGEFNGTFRIMDLISLEAKKDPKFLANLKMNFQGNSTITLGGIKEFNIIPHFSSKFNITGFAENDIDDLFSRLVDFLIDYFGNEYTDLINSFIGKLVMENVKVDKELIKLVTTFISKCPKSYAEYQDSLQKELSKGKTIKIRI